jgi:hypothetical protein
MATRPSLLRSLRSISCSGSEVSCSTRCPPCPSRFSDMDRMARSSWCSPCYSCSGGRVPYSSRCSPVPCSSQCPLSSPLSSGLFSFLQSATKEEAFSFCSVLCCKLKCTQVQVMKRKFSGSDNLVASDQSAQFSVPGFYTSYCSSQVFM